MLHWTIWGREPRVHEAGLRRYGSKFVYHITVYFSFTLITVTCKYSVLTQLTYHFASYNSCSNCRSPTSMQTWFGFLRRSLTSQVISIAFYIEREMTDKFCSEALILTWGSFTCRKSTTRDQRCNFPSEGSLTQDFYALKKSIDPGRGLVHFRRRRWECTVAEGGHFKHVRA